MSSRDAVAAAHRLVIKIGSSSLTDEAGHLDVRHMTSLVTAIAACHERGQDVVLVSSGAVAAGMAPLRLASRPRDLASKQAAAAVGQSLLVSRYASLFARHDLTVGQVLLTVEDVARQDHYHNALRTFTRLLELGVVPIVNENDTVVTHEIRFGDNDRLAALVAHLVSADALVLLSDVDALYTAPPSDPSACRIDEVADVDELRADLGRAGSQVGTGGMVTKIHAARIAAASGIPVVIGGAHDVERILAGEPCGTFFHATGKRRRRKLTWLAYASQTQGDLVVDDGAARALRESHASLLPAGIVATTGDFHAGDPVRVVDADGNVVGRGLVRYDASDMPLLMGHSTRELADSLGERFEREVVHRDDFILKAPKGRKPAR